MNMHMKKRIAIIGAGASGLLCALEAARGGHDVVVIEKNRKVGRKILATGNGRCNITNRTVTPAHYHGHHPAYVTHALRAFGSDDAIAYFRDLGLELITQEDGRIFPMSLQASSVSGFLDYTARARGVTFWLEREVHAVEREGERFVVVDQRGRARFDAVVIATGSAAMPSLGSSEAGISLAKRLGHNTFPTFPVLVQLVSQSQRIQKAAGVKIDASVRPRTAEGAGEALRGDLLFTNYGLSGLVILDISRVISAALARGEACAVEIDMLPDVSLSALKNILRKRAKKFADLPPELMLNGMLHKKLVHLLLEHAGALHAKPLDTKALQRIAYGIKHFSVAISDTRGAKGAEVMAGGVDCREVDPGTMQSRLHKGLYFTGEVLDIDGDRGGYNLHWAWASGYLAGRDLAR